jgi:hypothetical protein
MYGVVLLDPCRFLECHYASDPVAANAWFGISGLIFWLGWLMFAAIRAVPVEIRCH